jgi:hypothetical protein
MRKDTQQLQAAYVDSVAWRAYAGELLLLIHLLQSKWDATSLRWSPATAGCNSCIAADSQLHLLKAVRKATHQAVVVCLQVEAAGQWLLPAPAG